MHYGVYAPLHVSTVELGAMTGAMHRTCWATLHEENCTPSCMIRPNS
jgi:hypothetical protein